MLGKNNPFRTFMSPSAAFSLLELENGTLAIVSHRELAVVIFSGVKASTSETLVAENRVL
jgi:hypothetical protein